MSALCPSILVVDDEVDTCSNLTDIFSDFGYRVDVAYNGLQALELVKKNAYDVALLDLKMPGMDGLTLYREIRKLRAGTVALLVTAYVADAKANEALNAGVWHVLPKPVDFPQLMGFLEEAIRQPLVLVVDDDDDLCCNLWDVMRDQGYRVCVAHDEIEASERLTTRQYQVVLIDMKLPVGDGRRVFALTQQINPQAGTIAMTGLRPETEPLVQQVVAKGVDAVCYKPFDVSELLKTVKRLVEVGGEHSLSDASSNPV